MRSLASLLGLSTCVWSGCASSEPPPSPAIANTSAPEQPVASGDGLPEGAELVTLPEGTALRLYATHLHGGGLSGRCYGYIDISTDRVAYVPVKEQADHAFSFARVQTRAEASLMTYPNVNLITPSGTERFIIVDRDMVEQVRSVLATRAHTKSPKSLIAALAWNSSDVAAPAARTATMARPAPSSGGTPLGRIASARDVPARTAPSLGNQRRWDERFTAPLGSFYQLEAQLNFNVLDGAYFDPAGGQVTLYGHHEAHYEGPQIPYLQHLAALLENPRPEMTLEWTPESERRVHAFLNRTETRADAQRAAKSMGQFIDLQTRKVNEVGRLLLPGWGISPTRNGSPRRGYLGAEFAQQGEFYVRVVRVQPGSPAAAIGLQPGDVVTSILSLYPMNPAEVARLVGFQGSGSRLPLIVNGQEKVAVLGAATEDAWGALDAPEVFFEVLYHTRSPMAAMALDRIYATQRTFGTPAWGGAYANFLDALGLLPFNKRLLEQYGANDLMASKLFPQVATTLEQAFELPAGFIHDRYANTYARTHNHMAAGAEMDKAIREALPLVADRALAKIWNRQEGVQIAPELIDRTWGVRPEVRPKFMRVRPDTQLARAMLVGDYLGKRLVNMPELKASLPSYQTQYEFLERNPRFDKDRAAYRMWISVARFRGAQSPDHSTFEIRDIAMRFNIREIGGAGRSLPPVPGDYQELLTSLYDDLAQRFFVLHELREAAKLAGVAEWIRSRDPNFRLPAAGAPPWRPPATLPGMVFMYFHGQNTGGTLPVTTFATGGVALTPFEQSGRVSLADLAPVDTSVVDLRDRPLAASAGATPLIPPSYTNTRLAEIMHHSIDVPPPPPPEGWVGQAQNGRNTLRAVSVLRRQAGEDASVETYAKLAQLETLALQMQKLDAMINLINARSPELQRRSAEMVASLQADEARYKEQSFAIVRQAISDLGFELVLPPGTTADTVEGMAQFRDLHDTFEKYRSRLEALQSNDLHRQVAELSEIAGDLRDALEPYESSPVLGPALKTLKTAEAMRDVAELGSGFVKLFTISDYNVDRLYNDQDTRLRELNSLTSYKDKLQRKMTALQNDPALRALKRASAEKN